MSNNPKGHNAFKYATSWQKSLTTNNPSEIYSRKRPKIEKQTRYNTLQRIIIQWDISH